MRANRRAFLGSGTALLAGALLSACGVPTTPTVASQQEPTRRADLVGASLQIFHTNDVMGYVDPCG
jgi:hypothetical protein